MLRLAIRHDGNWGRRSPNTYPLAVSEHRRRPGDIVVAMPGEDGGLAADRIDPTAQNVNVATIFIPVEGADRTELDNPGSLGEIVQVEGSWPPAGWSELDVDNRGPVILNVPSG